MSEEKRRAPRKEISSTVEFVVDERHVLEARGVDISDMGIGFETSQPIALAMTVEVDGKEITRRAHLVRVTQKDDGNYLLGLEFDD